MGKVKELLYKEQTPEIDAEEDYFEIMKNMNDGIEKINQKKSLSGNYPGQVCKLNISKNIYFSKMRCCEAQSTRWSSQPSRAAG